MLVISIIHLGKAVALLALTTNRSARVVNEARENHTEASEDRLEEISNRL